MLYLALAYSCLCAFVDKFLMDFFRKKNSDLMQGTVSMTGNCGGELDLVLWQI